MQELFLNFLSLLFLLLFFLRKSSALFGYAGQDRFLWRKSNTAYSSTARPALKNHRYRRLTVTPAAWDKARV